jgi:hypothetical protein
MTLQQMAQAIVASRREFGEVFLQAQIEVGIAERDVFAAIALSGNDQQDFEAALTLADQKTWLNVLLQLLIDRGRHNGDLIDALKQLDPNNQALQAITNPLKGFPQPAQDIKRIAGAMQWTAKVIVSDPNTGVQLSTGTGVLIGAHLVLTAWHVVRDLFGKNPQGEYEPLNDSHHRLSVLFDYRLSGGKKNGPLAGESVPAHPDWCVAFSECHALELQSQLPQNLLQLDGKWDYAVIRLARTPGQERRWASLVEDAVVPIASSRMFLFQHPQGKELTYFQGAVEGANDPQLVNVVPQLRFLHAINTLGGSSGGPCFDSTFKLFGIHQGVWSGPANSNGASSNGGAAPAFNRGVPILRVRDSILLKLPELPAPNPEDNLVWQLATSAGADPVPVIGCDEMQTLTWRAAMNGKPRILHITGDRFIGKTFRVELLASLLHDGGHLKVPLRGPDELRKSPLELAKSICQIAGAQLKPIEAPQQLVSTSAEWLKGELVPAVLEALGAVRDGRVVWLLLRDLNRSTVQGDGTSDFLFALYETVASTEWLRVVLDGMDRDVPFSVRPQRVQLACAWPRPKDLADYLKRAIASGGAVPPDEIRAFANITGKDFDRYRTDNGAETAMPWLSDRLLQIREELERGV